MEPGIDLIPDYGTINMHQIILSFSFTGTKLSEQS